MDIERLKQLEDLLKEFHGLNNFPLHGWTKQQWQDDVIVSKEYTRKEEVRRKK